MIKWRGKKVTANEWAKLYVAEKGCVPVWFGGYSDVFEYQDGCMSEREKDLVWQAMLHQIDRVRDFLGVPAIEEKRGV